jgi:hypothetical protein
MQQRREFFGTLMGAAAAQVLAAQTRSGDMIYRTLGKTGERVSAIGLGGSHIGRPREEQEAIRIIRSAVDRGMNFMDNCWDYANGKCETWMGNALRDGAARRCTEVTKVRRPDKSPPRPARSTSRWRLQTDMIDLMQYHENIRMEDRQCFAGRSTRCCGGEGGQDPTHRIYGHGTRWCICAAGGGGAGSSIFDAARSADQRAGRELPGFGKQVVQAGEAGIALLGMKPLASEAIPRTIASAVSACSSH